MKQCLECGLEANDNGWHIETTPRFRYFTKCGSPSPPILFSPLVDEFPVTYRYEEESCSFDELLDSAGVYVS